MVGSAKWKVHKNFIEKKALSKKHSTIYHYFADYRESFEKFPAGIATDWQVSKKGKRAIISRHSKNSRKGLFSNTGRKLFFAFAESLIFSLVHRKSTLSRTGCSGNRACSAAEVYPGAFVCSSHKIHNTRIYLQCASNMNNDESSQGCSWTTDGALCSPSSQPANWSSGRGRLLAGHEKENGLIITMLFPRYPCQELHRHLSFALYNHLQSSCTS